jgi:hypothetical protein
MRALGGGMAVALIRSITAVAHIVWGARADRSGNRRDMDFYEDQQPLEDLGTVNLELLEIIQSIEEADRAALVPMFV